MPLRALERWISLVRLLFFPFVVATVALARYPHGWEMWSWLATGAYGVGAVALFAYARSEAVTRHAFAQSLVAQVFDTGIVMAFVFAYSFERGLPSQQILYIDLAAACVRFQFVGGLSLALVSAPILVVFERLRENQLGTTFSWKLVAFQTALEVMMALIVGWLVQRLATEGGIAEARAIEAESLRDELRKRADLTDAANRCARALASPLDLGEAFGAFIRQLEILLPFDRVSIVLAQNDRAQVIAASGVGADTVSPAGYEQQVEGTTLGAVLADGTLLETGDISESAFADDRELAALGLHSRIAAPLTSGAETVGMLAVLRRRPDGFTSSDVDLLVLLGRFVAATAQNVHAYAAERSTVEELKRLSTLRSDFVSLVSHEVRTPLAAVIGSARTLQSRWDDLDAKQREAFLALIADETDRLATLVGEVLDSSRIDSGTFSYTFEDLDVGTLVRETVATRDLANEEVAIVAEVDELLPTVRGDSARLQQVLVNLIENAVKYSRGSAPVEVHARAKPGAVAISVIDHGPGIAEKDQKLIFERFGRVRQTSFLPGTGLGLYISSGIAEAHNGTLDVRSRPGEGATFTLTLPASTV